MSQNKLGLYVQATSNELKEFIQKACPRDGSPFVIVTLAYDKDFWRDICAEFPNIILVVRWWVDAQEQQDKIRTNPTDAAHELTSNLFAIPIVSQGIAKYVMGYNEFIGYNNPELWGNADIFQSKLYDWLMPQGIEPIAFNNGVGNLYGADYVKHFPQTLQRYRYYGFHSYSWPTIMDGYEYYTGRFEEVMPHILKVRPDAKAIITELGLTELVAGGKKDYGYTTKWSDQEYWGNSLSPINGRFIKFPWLEGSAVFMCGVGDHGEHEHYNWDTFDILPSTYIADRMAELSNLPSIPQPEEKPMKLSEQYPDLFDAWRGAGGIEDNFLEYLVGIDALKVTSKAQLMTLLGNAAASISAARKAVDSLPFSK